MNTYKTTADDIVSEAMLENNSLAEVVKRSFASAGNTYRLSRKLAQAAEGKEITCAFIGGSITEGYPVKPNECYAKLTFEWIKEEYGAENLRYINAGLSGTPSILGNLRLNRDVPSADIVFVEFAVNDGSDNIFRESYDSLIRTLLERDDEPAVILLFNRMKQGYSAQEHMKQIGEFYELGMISTADAFTYGLDEGKLEWDSFYTDDAHPNPDGHRLFLDCIKHYFKMALRTPSEKYELKAGSPYGAPYKSAFMAEADYDNSDSRLIINDVGCFDIEASGLNKFRKGWRYNPESGKSAMCFTATGNSLFIVCHRNNKDIMGSMIVYISDNPVTINTNMKDGWGDPWAYQVFRQDTITTMAVRIEVPKDSADKICEILAIGVTNNEGSFM